MNTIIMMVIAMVFMRFGPDIEFRRTLNHFFVERLATFLSGKKRHDWLFFALVVPVFALGGEMVAILGPEFMLAYAADLALYLDLMVVGAATSALARIRNAAYSARRAVTSTASKIQSALPGANRAKRSARKPETHAAKNDNDEGDHRSVGFGYALAA